MHTYFQFLLSIDRVVGTTIEDTDHWTQRGWWIACDLPATLCIRTREREHL